MSKIIHWQTFKKKGIVTEQVNDIGEYLQENGYKKVEEKVTYTKKPRKVVKSIIDYKKWVNKVEYSQIVYWHYDYPNNKKKIIIYGKAE